MKVQKYLFLFKWRLSEDLIMEGQKTYRIHFLTSTNEDRRKMIRREEEENSSICFSNLINSIFMGFPSFS